MARTSRRTFLVGSAVLPVAAAAARVSVELQAKVAADLDKYIGFGSKQAGGAGDNACGNWLAAEIEGLGFKVERQNVATNSPRSLPRAMHRPLECSAFTAIITSRKTTRDACLRPVLPRRPQPFRP